IARDARRPGSRPATGVQVSCPTSNGSGQSERMDKAKGQLEGERILLCVCGGIAAYKSADLVRRLRDAGAGVRVAMTEAATRFVGPTTFQALSGEPVRTDRQSTRLNSSHV